MAYIRNGAADITEGEVRRIHKLSRIEPALRGALVARQFGTHSRRVRTVGLEVVGTPHRERDAALHYTDQVDLPAAYEPAQHAAGWTPTLAAPHRQLVERAHHEALRYVPGI